MGRKAGIVGSYSPSWAPLGPLLGPSWGPLGPSWAPLGPFWSPLGPSWGPLGGLLGRLGAVFRASWSVLERRKHEKARTQKTLKNTAKICNFGLLEPSWEASWSALGASWRPLGPSWGHLGRLGALLGRLGGLLGPLGRFLGPSWPVLGPFGLSKIHARMPRSAQERAEAPRSALDQRATSAVAEVENIFLDKYAKSTQNQCFYPVWNTGTERK